MGKIDCEYVYAKYIYVCMYRRVRCTHLHTSALYVITQARGKVTPWAGTGFSDHPPVSATHRWSSLTTIMLLKMMMMMTWWSNLAG